MDKQQLLNAVTANFPSFGAGSVCFAAGVDIGQVLDFISTIPIDMIIFCPVCGTQHVDEPEPDSCTCSHRRDKHDPTLDDGGPACFGEPDCPCERFVVAWDNPPHKSHLCHGCSTVFRFADVATNGVATIKSIGVNDTWTAPLWSTKAGLSRTGS